jgi:hypothetical protein
MAGRHAMAQSRSPNEKLNIGIIGVHSRGAANMAATESENIVALCDVDENYLTEAAKKHPKAKTYIDWRKMLDQKYIDAVVVSTTEHTHALASVMAMKRGKHVYCEKPLAHSVYEARVMRETCKQMKVATQMGTQIHATDNYRRVVELVQSGAIGPVGEVHVWVDQGIEGPRSRPQETPPVPKTLHWDLWLGPAQRGPITPATSRTVRCRGRTGGILAMGRWATWGAIRSTCRSGRWSCSIPRQWRPKAHCRCDWKRIPIS